MRLIDENLIAVRILRQAVQRVEGSGSVPAESVTRPKRNPAALLGRGFEAGTPLGDQRAGAPIFAVTA